MNWAPMVRRHWPLVVILVAFVSLGTLYSLVTPIFEASDELWHYPFVKHLADGGGLPVQDPANPQPWRQEGSQPPLYYALGALATLWIDTDDLPQLLRYNPHADIGVLRPDGNVNMVVHSEAEGFPYRGTALAVHVVRLLSVCMGAGTVFLTYLIALATFPDGEWLAAGAAAFNAFVPMFLFISGSVNNDNLVVLLCSWALLLTIRLLDASRSARHLAGAWHFSLLGLVLGLAALSKVSALGLAPIIALALGLAAFRRRSAAFFLKGVALVGGVAALVAGWWYFRNWRLYGDPLGLNVFVATVGPRHPPPTLLQLISEGEGFLMSFWGLFGGVNVPAEPNVYRALNVLAALGSVGLVIYLVRSARRLAGAWHLGDNLEEAKILVLLAWPLIVFAALIRWTTITKASQGRLMFPAISAIAILLAVGWSVWLRRRDAGFLLGPLAVALFLIALLVPFRSIAPAYARPPSLSEAEIESIPHRLDVNFGDKMTLLGYKVPGTSQVPGTSEVRPGESLQVTVYWRSLARMERDWSVFVHLLGENDIMLAQRDTYPGLGNYPTSQWERGTAISDTYTLALPPTVYAPDKAQFEVGLYDFSTKERLPVRKVPGTSSARFHQVAVVRRTRGEVPNALYFNFEGRIALVGYDLDRRAALAGETIRLTLYWLALADGMEDYTVFAHVLGEDDTLWAQKDSQPQGGAAPTSTWRKGQIFADEYELVVKPNTPPDVYDVEVGLYSVRTGARLRVLDQWGRVQDDRLLLSKVRVVGS